MDRNSNVYAALGRPQSTSQSFVARPSPFGVNGSPEKGSGSSSGRPRPGFEVRNNMKEADGEAPGGKRLFDEIESEVQANGAKVDSQKNKKKVEVVPCGRVPANNLAEEAIRKAISHLRRTPERLLYKDDVVDVVTLLLRHATHKYAGLIATVDPSQWAFVDPSTLGLSTDLTSTHSFFTYLGTHHHNLTTTNPGDNLRATLANHPYAPRLAKTLDDTPGNRLIRFSSYGGQVHTWGKTPQERLLEEHEGGHGSGTALFSDVLKPQVFGECHMRHVVFSFEAIYTVAEKLCEKREGRPKDHLRLVTDVAEAITCAASACHVLSGGYNCTAGGGIYGDPSFRLQAIFTPLLPRTDMNVQEKMTFLCTLRASDLVDTDHGLEELLLIHFADRKGVSVGELYSRLQSIAGSAAATSQAELIGSRLPAHGHDGMILRLAGVGKVKTLTQAEAEAAVAKAKRKRQDGGTRSSEVEQAVAQADADGQAAIHPRTGKELTTQEAESARQVKKRKSEGGKQKKPVDKRKTTRVQDTVEAGYVKGWFKDGSGQWVQQRKLARWRTESRDELDLYFWAAGKTSRLESHVQEGRMQGVYEFEPK